MPRTSSSTRGYSYKYTDLLTGQSTNSSGDYPSWYFTRSDVKRIPFDPWKFRPPSAYSAEMWRYSRPTGTLFTEGAGYKRKYEGTMWFSNNLVSVPGIDTRLGSAAEVQALLALKDQKINLAQAFAERAQTANLVASNAKAIAKMMMNLRRGKFGKVRPKDIPQRWMEMQYGWKPLLSDVYGSCAALADRYSDIKHYRMTVRGKKQKDITDHYELVDNGGIDVVVRGKEKCLVSLSYVPSNVLLRSLNEAGITNPLQLAWELMPYSFVVDWFYPIGDWLSAMDAATGWTFIGGSKTHARRVTAVGVGPLKKNAPSWSGHLTQREYRSKMDRTTYISSPIPLSPGKLKNPWSYDHVANALSLLALAFERKGR